MLRFIAGVKGAIQVTGYELELGVSRVCHAHVLLTHVAPTWATTRATPRAPIRILFPWLRVIQVSTLLSCFTALQTHLSKKNASPCGRGSTIHTNRRLMVLAPGSNFLGIIAPFLLYSLVLLQYKPTFRKNCIIAC
jgi:hypothetical protein